jgi:hypothetical protein
LVLDVHRFPASDRLQQTPHRGRRRCACGGGHGRYLGVDADPAIVERQVREHLVRVTLEQHRRESVGCPVGFLAPVVDDIGRRKRLVKRQVLRGLRHLNTELIN